MTLNSVVQSTYVKALWFFPIKKRQISSLLDLVKQQPNENCYQICIQKRLHLFLICISLIYIYLHFLYITLTQTPRQFSIWRFVSIFHYTFTSILLKADNTINSFNKTISGVNIRTHIIEYEKINRVVACDIKLDANKHLGCILPHKRTFMFKIIMTI